MPPGVTIRLECNRAVVQYMKKRLSITTQGAEIRFAFVPVVTLFMIAVIESVYLVLE